VVDDNSTTVLRQRPLHVRTFWRRYCTVQAFFLDAVCREPYTAACSHALPRRQCTPHWLFMNHTEDADTESAHGFLHYSGESEALFVLDNAFREKSKEVA